MKKKQYIECAEYMQSLGMVSSKPEFRKWCKDNPDRRIKLGIPTDPLIGSIKIRDGKLGQFS